MGGTKKGRKKAKTNPQGRGRPKGSTKDSIQTDNVRKATTVRKRNQREREKYQAYIDELKHAQGDYHDVTYTNMTNYITIVD